MGRLEVQEDGLLDRAEMQSVLARKEFQRRSAKGKGRGQDRHQKRWQFQAGKKEEQKEEASFRQDDRSKTALAGH